MMAVAPGAPGASVDRSHATATGLARGRSRRRGRALRKLTWVELKLVLREPLTLVFSFAFPVVLLFVMGEVFGQNSGEPGEVVWRDFGAMNYYIPSYLALVACAFGMISLPTHLAAYRERGVLRRLHASGVRERQVLGSQTLVGFALTTVGAVLVVVLGMLFYDVRGPVSIPALILAYALSTLCFMILGCLLGALIPRARAAQGIGLILFFVMMFVSGTAPPIEVMSGVMLGVGKALPLYHAAIALQDAWNGLGVNGVELGILAAAAAGGLVLTNRLFRWD
jgi:ABC-2 type transport system permease protein